MINDANLQCACMLLQVCERCTLVALIVFGLLACSWNVNTPLSKTAMNA